MAREIRLVITCDGEPGKPCEMEVAEDAAPVSFAFGGVTYVRDLCFPHGEEFLGLMKALVSVSTPEAEVPGVTAPRPARGKEKAPRVRKYAPRRPAPKATCPECLEKLAAHTLVKHVKGQHPDSRFSEQAIQEIVDSVKRDDEAARLAEALALTQQGASNGKT